MNQETNTNNNPLIGSNEHKIKILKSRKTELLLRKELAKDAGEIRHVEDLLKAVDEVIERHNLAAIINRRIEKNDEI
jgi:hypothetical protein